MLISLRRLQKTKVGTAVIALFFIMILIGFASTGVTNFGSGNLGFGLGSSTLAKVGGEQITEPEMSEAMQRRLQQVRQQKPDADYATIAGDFDTLLNDLIDQKTLLAFAEKFHFPLSKRLVDAEIAQIPQTKGLNGQFNEQAYQAFLAQQRLTDFTGAANPRGRTARTLHADASRSERPRIGRDGHALCGDVARIARGRGRRRPDRRSPLRTKADGRRPSAILYRQP